MDIKRNTPIYTFPMSVPFKDDKHSLVQIKKVNLIQDAI